MAITLSKADYDMVAHLDTQQVRDSIYEIEKHAKSMADSLDKAFSTGSQSSQQASGSTAMLSAKLGIAMGIATELTRTFIQFGTQSVNQLKAVSAEATGMAGTIQQANIAMTNILGGGERGAKAASDFLTLLRQESAKLGVSFRETAQFSKTLLPDTSSMSQFRELLQIATLMSRDQPEQGFMGARFAIEEALGGQYRSLQTRFDLRKSVIDAMRADVESGMSPIESIISRLGAEYERQGYNLEAFAGTYENMAGRVQAKTDEIKLAMGEPLLEQRMAEMERMGKFMGENSDELQELAALLGKVMAEFQGFFNDVWMDMLEGIDMDTVLDLGQNLLDAWEAARLLMEVLTGTEELNMLQSAIKGANWLVESLEKAAFTAAQISAMVKSDTARLQAETEKLSAMRPDNFLVKQAVASGGLAADSWTAKQVFTEEERAEAAAAGERARIKVLEEALVSFDDYNKRLEENAKWRGEVTDKIKEQADADEELIDEILAEKAALLEAEEVWGVGIELRDKVKDANKEAATARKEANKAEKEYQELLEAQGPSMITYTELKRVEVLKELAAALEEQAQAANTSFETWKKYEAAIKTTQEAEEALMATMDESREKIVSQAAFTASEGMIKASEKREDIETSYLQKREDAWAKYWQDVEDSGIKEQNRAAQVRLEGIQGEEKIRSQYSQKAIEREKNFRDELQQINRQADMDLQEAAESQDAIAFVRIVRRREQELAEAQIKNEQQLQQDNMNLQTELEQQALSIQQKAEQQALADEQAEQQLELHLERELQKTDQYRERELEKAKTAEERRVGDLQRQLDQRLEQWQAEYDKELEALQEKHKAEYDLIKSHYKEISELKAQYMEGVERGLEATSDRYTGLARYYGKSPGASERVTPARSMSIIGRQFGGDVRAGQRYRVGEAGPEDFVPYYDGSVLPGSGRGWVPQMGPSSVTSNTNYSFSAGWSMLDSSRLSPEQAIMVEQIATSRAVATFRGLMGGG